MLQRTGEAETITTHYLFALGIYRALYIPNWIYRYFANERNYSVAIIAGIIQTILYSDFFWIYYTKFVPLVFDRFYLSLSIIVTDCDYRVLKGKKFSLPV